MKNLDGIWIGKNSGTRFHARWLGEKIEVTYEGGPKAGRINGIVWPTMFFDQYYNEAEGWVVTYASGLKPTKGGKD